MRTSLSVLCAAFLASMYFRSYFGVVGPLVSDDLALSPVEFGWLASAFFGSFALLQIPVGIAFDRWGVRWPMASMMVMGAAGSALIASSSGFWSAFAGQVAIGIGCARIFMGILYYLGRHHSPDTAARLAATVSSVGIRGSADLRISVVLLHRGMGLAGRVLDSLRDDAGLRPLDRGIVAPGAVGQECPTDDRARNMEVA
nr:MFS transporter [Rhizobium leguminosarum]